MIYSSLKKNRRIGQKYRELSYGLHEQRRGGDVSGEHAIVNVTENCACMAHRAAMRKDHLQV